MMMNFGAAVMRLLQQLVNPTALISAGSVDWIPTTHLDRLRQYALFRALDEGHFATLLKDKEDGKKLREYGDAGLINVTSRDAVFGDQLGFDVPGATDQDNVGARARKLLLERWGARERWATRIITGEGDAAAVGDAVYELRADGTRLRLRGHSPEHFFPVWESDAGEFTEAYLAWEEENTGQWPGSTEPLPRLRARLGDVVLYRRHYRVETAAGGKPRCLVTAGWYSIKMASGQQDQPSLDDLTLIAAELTSSGTPVVDLDTGFEDVPLYFVPNIESTRQPWGLPEAHGVYQVLLDLQKDHADLAANTYANAFPILYDENPPVGAGRAVPGGGAPTKSQETYKPGTLYNGRKIGVVDLSKGNELLLEHERFLVEKALTNSRTTAVAAGRVAPNEVPSGVALLIALMPLAAKTMPKRVTRRDKLGMLLKHALRWTRDQADPRELLTDADLAGADLVRGPGGWPAGIWDDDRAYPTFGAILPIDRQQMATNVRDLVAANAMSLETAVACLQLAGFPIDDARAEVERIREDLQPPAGAPGSGLGNEGKPIPIPGLDDEDDDVPADKEKAA
jgi:hypothetical protein